MPLDVSRLVNELFLHFRPPEFVVGKYRVTNRDDVEAKLRQFADEIVTGSLDVEAPQPDAVVVVMVTSAGTHPGLVRMRDGDGEEEFGAASLIELLNDTGCPPLQGKPRIMFFVQAGTLLLDPADNDDVQRTFSSLPTSRSPRLSDVEAMSCSVDVQDDSEDSDDDPLETDASPDHPTAQRRQISVDESFVPSIPNFYMVHMTSARRRADVRLLLETLADHFVPNVPLRTIQAKVEKKLTRWYRRRSACVAGTGEGREGVPGAMLSLPTSQPSADRPFVFYVSSSTDKDIIFRHSQAHVIRRCTES